MTVPVKEVIVSRRCTSCGRWIRSVRFGRNLAGIADGDTRFFYHAS